MDVDLDIEGDIALEEAFDDLQTQGESEAVYVVESGAEYAVYLEFGTEDMPPYPYFRPAIREFQANPESFIRDNTEFAGLNEIDSTDQLVKAVALALESQIKTNATAESGGRSPGTHPDHPQVQTTNLRSKIRARRLK